MDNIPIVEYLEKFDKGDFNNPSVDTQIDAGWYDWFCRDTSLRNKTIKLTRLLKQIVKSPKINQKTMYVWFKNNCPGHGSLYDDFRIADIDTGETLYCITPASGHKQDKGRASVWGKENNFDGPLVEGTWKDVKKWFIGG